MRNNIFQFSFLGMQSWGNKETCLKGAVKYVIFKHVYSTLHKTWTVTMKFIDVFYLSNEVYYRVQSYNKLVFRWRNEHLFS